MGRIYYNEETGDIWVSGPGRRRPPSGYIFSGHRDGRDRVFGTILCRRCGKHHFYIYYGGSEVPRWLTIYRKFVERYGCECARLFKMFYDGFGSNIRIYRALEMVLDGGVEISEAEVVRLLREMNKIVEMLGVRGISDRRSRRCAVEVVEALIEDVANGGRGLIGLVDEWGAVSDDICGMVGLIRRWRRDVYWMDEG